MLPEFDHHASSTSSQRCKNRCLPYEKTCLLHEGFDPSNQSRSIPKSPKVLRTPEEPLNSYNPEYLQQWLRYKNVIIEEDCCLIELVRHCLNQIWTENTDSSTSYIDIVPSDCLFQLLSYLDIGIIMNMRFVSKKYYELVFPENFWKNKISQIDLSNPRKYPVRKYFVESVFYGIYPLFEMLLPVIRRDNNWNYDAYVGGWFENRDGTLEQVWVNRRSWDTTLIQVALHGNHRKIIKRLLEIAKDEGQKTCRGLEIDVLRICEIDRKFNQTLLNNPSISDENTLQIGSVKDDILRIYLNILIDHHPLGDHFDIKEIVDALIENLSIDDLNIWIERFRDFYLNEEHKINYFRYFCGSVLSILCRIDEYETFMECFERYQKLSWKSYNFILSEVMKIDNYPFRYVKFLQEVKDENIQNDLMKYKERWKRI